MRGMKSEIEKDAQLIELLGGPAKIARMLGYSADIGVQRVNNWRSRGIPAKVKISRPDLFLRAEQKEQQEAA